MPDVAHPVALRRDGVAVVLDVPEAGLPAVLHWGADLGPLDDAALALLGTTTALQRAPGTLDHAWRPTLLPQEGDGWSGRPGLLVARDGRPVFPRWRVTEIDADAHALRCTAESDGLLLRSRVEIGAGGVVEVDHEVTSTAAGSLEVVHVEPTLPVPKSAATLTSFGGRWSQEKVPTTLAMPPGAWLRETRRGRAGHDQPWVTYATEAAPLNRSGQVWAVHLGWSADVRHRCDRLPEQVTVLGAGELLRPHEVHLAPHESYRTPTAYFAWSGDGLDGVGERFHTWVRARGTHPRTPRPFTLNVWEAVYFDHDPEHLAAIARRAAAVGVERFVIDDGWFLGRVDDTSSLGDWVVDPMKYPDGMEPLAALVHDLGMQLGLWFEPEMICLDSDAARAHPGWLLHAPGSVPEPPGLNHRFQHVVDLAHPDAFAHVLGQMSDVIGRLGVGYVKWDHNRDLVEPLHDGRPGTHEQTLAAYRLMDALKAAHPGLEIESCSSGGARTDLGILAHSDRVWASDNNDPVERQDLHRWTELVLPPELVGSHVGPSPACVSERVTPLSYRAAVALHGHAGLEWDVTECDDDELAAVAAYGALYREMRDLLHTGTVVHPDHLPSWLRARGVVAPDRRRALWTLTSVRGADETLSPRLRLLGLDPDLTYAVRVRDDVGAGRRGGTFIHPAWMREDELRVPGSLLAGVGLQLPTLMPVQAMVIEATAV
jgi:alpha-galactosidase